MTRDTILLFTSMKEPVSELSDEDAGKLLKAILAYQTDEPVKLEGLLKVVFLQVKQQIDYNNSKYLEQAQKRSDAGKKGMASRWGKDNKDNKDNNVIGVITGHNKNNLNVNDNVNVLNATSSSRAYARGGALNPDDDYDLRHEDDGCKHFEPTVRVTRKQG